MNRTSSDRQHLHELVRKFDHMVGDVLVEHVARHRQDERVPDELGEHRPLEPARRGLDPPQLPSGRQHRGRDPTAQRVGRSDLLQ